MSLPSTIRADGVGGHDPRDDWRCMNGWLVGRRVEEEEITTGNVEGEVQFYR